MVKSTKIDLVITIILPLVVFALFMPQRHHGLSLWDEGLNLYTTERIYDGQVPFRDFILPYGPAKYYLQAWLFRILGVNVTTGKIYMILTLAFASMATYLVARQIKIWIPLSILCSFLILHNSTSLLFIPTFDRILWSFLSLLLVMHYLNKGKKRNLFLAGIITGFTFLICQIMGLFVMGATIIVLVFKFIKNFRKTNQVPNISVELGIFVGGIFCVIGPYLIYLIHQGAISQYFFESFIRHTRSKYSSLFIGQTGIVLGFKSFFRAAIQTKDLRAALYAHRFYGLIFVCLAALCFIFWKSCLTKNKIDITYLKVLLLALFGIFMFYIPLHKYMRYYILMALPPGIVLSAYFLQKMLIYQATAVNRKTLKILSIIIIIYLSFHYLSSLRAVINTFFSLNRCQGWSINLDRAKISFPLHKKGEIKQDLPFKNEKEFLDIINYIKGNTSVDSKIFIASLDAMLYFLMERDNATRFDSINWTDLASEDTTDQKDIIEDLITKKATYVIFSNVVCTHENIPYKQYVKKLIPLVYDFVIKNYELEKSINHFEFWKLIDD